MKRLEIINFANPSPSDLKKYKQFKVGEKRYGGVKNDIKRALVLGTPASIPGATALTLGALSRDVGTKAALKTAGTLGLLASIPIGLAGAAYVR
jgi:hypothetical protein